MTETIQETRMREAMEPLGEILGSLQLILKQKTASVFLLIICMIGLGGLAFGESGFSQDRKIIISTFSLIILLISSYFEFKRFRKIEKAYSKIETEPYEFKSDLIRAKETVSSLIPSIYPKYSNWVGFFAGFNLPFIFLKEYLKEADDYFTFSISRFWESPIFIFSAGISCGVVVMWLSKRSSEKTKSEQYFQPLERLQWIIDNYDKPN